MKNAIYVLLLIAATVTISGRNSGSTAVLATDTLANKSYVRSYANTAIASALPKVDSMQVYTSTGIVRQKIKIWTVRVAVATSTGFSVDISSAGFSTVLSTQVTAERNTGVLSSVPNVAVKTIGTTAVTMNLNESSTSLVTILGISVLSGLPVIAASTTGLYVNLTVIGY